MAWRDACRRQELRRLFWNDGGEADEEDLRLGRKRFKNIYARILFRRLENRVESRGLLVKLGFQGGY